MIKYQYQLNELKIMHKPSETHQEIAAEIYQGFCEGEAENSPFQEAWYAFEEKHGTIQSCSIEENLVFQAMLYAIQVGVDDYYNPSIPPKMRVLQQVRHKTYPISGVVSGITSTDPSQYIIDWGGGSSSTEPEENLIFEGD